ncbi:2-oxo-hept-4-ene-1,7-dioate hydratase [Azohydromonas australica]|uniref:2-oxo-hept-4-ene-1,7-dioate hydratase n=1 Tax=Azohydromonas australica TaxID=364039 RepID=UPI000405FAF2|nr:2-oxo-hepta-3-ene-1,7-dioic acid hydratase [Azohydromonas australica]
MLNETLRQEAAHQLLQAERIGKPLPRLSDTYPEMDIEDAYDVQLKVVAMKVEAGARVRGYKIGLTSKAMQDAVGISEPDFGHLFEDMFHADGARLSASRYHAPRLEVELAFVLNRRLKGPGVTVSDVLSATEHVVPALELIDSRTVLPRKFVDTLADNAASAGVVMGGRPVRPMDVDLRWLGAVVYKNAVIEDSGMSAAVLGHPANGVAWLANRLGERGVCLEPGQVLLGGSFTRPLAAAAGDIFHVDYGPLGGIAVGFTE